MSDHPQHAELTEHTPSPRARYIMLGGFLGAGKTTSVLRLAQELTRRSLRVGLITNDQGQNLVDTAMLVSHGFAVEEISGGCFCCRFPSLREASEKLSADERPDVLIAEAVGSCTDLVATVSYPLRRMYGDQYVIAPLTVVVDPKRALRILGVEAGKTFSEKVTYIYRKQLEEAGIILLNKIDDLTPERRAALRAALEREYPQATVLEVSAREGEGMTAWFDLVSRDVMQAGSAMNIDYQTYGEGEALLGWLNGTVSWDAADWMDANAWLLAFADELQSQLASAGHEIAHLKMTLVPSEEDQIPGLAILNLVGNEVKPEAAQTLPDLVRSGNLIVNMRVEAEPQTLRDALEHALVIMGRKGPGVLLKLDHLEAFKPGQPVPVYRDEVSV